MQRLFFILLLLPCFCSGQNLVPNPSFEDTVQCPDGVDQVSRSDGWVGLATSDYYHSCSSVVSTPSNQAGYQVPASGQAYCGFFNMELSNWGEFITRRLSDTLDIGQTYFVSLKVAFGNNPIFINCATNNMGVLLSVDSMTSPPINDTAHLYSPTVITDSLNWTIIAGSFVADSAYKYIMIGNFFNPSNTDTIMFEVSPWCRSYYLVDDICVSEDSVTCDWPTTSTIEFNREDTGVNVYPNPTTGLVTITNIEQGIKNIEVFDLFGRSVPFDFDIGRSLLDIQGSPAGVYFVKAGQAVRKLIKQ